MWASLKVAPQSALRFSCLQLCERVSCWTLNRAQPLNKTSAAPKEHSICHSSVGKRVMRSAQRNSCRDRRCTSRQKAFQAASWRRQVTKAAYTRNLRPSMF
jgi:hypothetical protein